MDLHIQRLRRFHSLPVDAVVRREQQGIESEAFWALLLGPTADESAATVVMSEPIEVLSAPSPPRAPPPTPARGKGGKGFGKGFCGGGFGSGFGGGFGGGFGTTAEGEDEGSTIPPPSPRLTKQPISLLEEQMGAAALQTVVSELLLAIQVTCI